MFPLAHAKTVLAFFHGFLPLILPQVDKKGGCTIGWARFPTLLDACPGQIMNINHYNLHTAVYVHAYMQVWICIIMMSLGAEYKYPNVPPYVLLKIHQHVDAIQGGLLQRSLAIGCLKTAMKGVRCFFPLVSKFFKLMKQLDINIL